MPAEWERHEATWLAWPHNEETWPSGRLDKVCRIYLIMLEALLDYEKVHLLVRDAAEESRVLKLLRAAGVNLKNLIVHPVPTADSWIRDYGPVFLKHPSGSKAWCKWIFNAWGEKYGSHLRDNDVFLSPSVIPGTTRFEIPMVLEGGSIEVNGEGDCLVTEECLLNPNRNPALSREDIERRLRDYLGISRVIWLQKGIEGDDTDGHIDEIARFTDSETILFAAEHDAADANYEILKSNAACLQRSETQKGRKWRLVALPMPSACRSGSERLPASYANFYIANELLFIPVFECPADDRALHILKEHFPKRTVVPVPCRDLIFGLGALHCITQQEPA